jgi:hypothetical protein
MDDRYPDFWAESTRRGRPRRDPFRVRLVVLLVTGALLTPIALLARGTDGDVVTGGGLPGAAVVLEPRLGGAGSTTSGAPTALPTPDTAAAGTLPPALGAKAAPASAAPSSAAPAGQAAGAAPDAAVAGTLPPAVGTLPATVPAPPPEPATDDDVDPPQDSDGDSGSGSSSTGAAPQSRQASPPAPDPTEAPTPRAAPAPRPTPAPKPAPTPAPAPPPARYTSAQVEALIRKAFPDDQEERALEIAWRESRHNPSAYNGWCCYGLFQIYFEANSKFLATLGITSAAQLYDPVLNVRAALAMFQRSGWGPWGG